MIALGAIIAYAVDLGQVGPVDIQLIGQILLIVGLVGLVLGMVLAATSVRARRQGAHSCPAVSKSSSLGL